MTLENQCCTLEQGKKLKELGVKINSLFVHVDNTSSIGYEGIKLATETTSFKMTKKVTDGGVIKYYPAFTVAELGAMLPEQFTSWKYITSEGEYWSSIADENNHANLEFEHELTEAQARASQLIHLLEHELITADEVNKQLLK